MAKMVGLSRSIKLEWLNKTVDFLLEGMDAAQIRESLNDYLSYEIKSATNLRKTREILMTIWVNTPYDLLPIRQLALDVYKTEKSRLASHWSMLLVAYPVFFDHCSLIGKLSSMQETFSTPWLKERLFEIWGERSTLFYSVEKILQTLKFMGAIDAIKPGVYQINKQKVESRYAIQLLISTILYLKEKAYYEVSELSCLPELFPFDFDVSYEWFHSSESFKLGNFGGKVVLMNE